MDARKPLMILFNPFANRRSVFPGKARQPSRHVDAHAGEREQTMVFISAFGPARRNWDNGGSADTPTERVFPTS